MTKTAQNAARCGASSLSIASAQSTGLGMLQDIDGTSARGQQGYSDIDAGAAARSISSQC